MTIDRHPRSQFFRCRFIDSTGTRVCRTLKTSDRSVAMQMALDLESAAKRARAGSLTTDRARALLNEVLESTGQALIDTESFKVFASRWLKAKTGTKANGTAVRYAGTVKQFLLHLGPLASRPVSAILPAHVETFRDKLADAGRAPSSIRVEIKTLSALFTKATREGIITKNPVGSVELDGQAGREREPFTAEEFAALVKKADDEWKTAILLAGLAGLRLGDAVSRKWAEIDLAEGTLSFTPEKTKKPMTLPLHPRLAEHLEAIAGDTDGLLCPKLATGSTGGRQGLSRQFQDLMTNAGIKSDIQKDKGRALAKKTFHSLRHYFNTLLLRSGVDEATRMKMAGHASPEMSRKYSHVGIQDLRTAMDKIK